MVFNAFTAALRQLKLIYTSHSIYSNTNVMFPSLTVVRKSSFGGATDTAIRIASR